MESVIRIRATAHPCRPRTRPLIPRRSNSCPGLDGQRMRSAAISDRLRNSMKLCRYRGEYGAPGVPEILIAPPAGSQLLGSLTTVAHVELAHCPEVMRIRVVVEFGSRN